MDMRDLYMIHRMSRQSFQIDYAFLHPYASVGGKGPVGDWLIFSFHSESRKAWIAVISQPDGSLSLLEWHYPESSNAPVAVKAVHGYSEPDTEDTGSGIEFLLRKLPF